MQPGRPKQSTAMAQVAPVMMVVAAGPPGTVMQVQANGATLQIQVPEGCAAGQQFPVALPTAPVVQGVAYVPGEVSGTPGLKGLVAALNMPDGSAGVLDMRQHWSGLEAFTGGAYEKANIYDIHHCPPDPNDKAAKFAPESKVAQIVAHSTTCERTCAPGHSLMLHVNDRAGNTMVTIQRPGWGTGKYCLNHGACANCCRDEIIVHEGRVDAEATCCLCCHFNFCCFKHFDGCGQRVLNPSPVSKASVPFLGGGCKPQIDVFEDHDSARPNRRVNGPCCFGGPRRGVHRRGPVRCATHRSIPAQGTRSSAASRSSSTRRWTGGTWGACGSSSRAPARMLVWRCSLTPTSTRWSPAPRGH